MKHVAPLIDLAQGETQAALGQMEAALEAYEQAEARGAEMGMRPTIWQAQAGAARALDALSRPAEADAKRQAARSTIDEIAALFQDAGLREQFVEDALSQIRGLVAVG